MPDETAFETVYDASAKVTVAFPGGLRPVSVTLSGPLVKLPAVGDVT